MWVFVTDRQKKTKKPNKAEESHLYEKRTLAKMCKCGQWGGKRSVTFPEVF